MASAVESACPACNLANRIAAIQNSIADFDNFDSFDFDSSALRIDDLYTDFIGFLFGIANFLDYNF